MFQFRTFVSILLCTTMAISFSACSQVAESYDNSYAFLYKIYLDDIDENKKETVIGGITKELKQRGIENASTVNIDIDNNDEGSFLNVTVNTNQEDIDEVRTWLEDHELFQLMIGTDKFDDVLGNEDEVNKRIDELKENIRQQAQTAFERIKKGEDFALVAQESAIENVQHAYFEAVDWKYYEDLIEPFNEIISDLEPGELHDEVITYTAGNVFTGPQEMNVILKLDAKKDAVNEEGEETTQYKYSLLVFHVKPDGYELIGIDSSNLIDIEKLYSEEYEPYFRLYFDQEAVEVLKQTIADEKNNEKLLAFFFGSSNIYSLLINEKKHEQLTSGIIDIHPKFNSKEEMTKFYEALRDLTLLKSPIIYLEGQKLN